MKAMDPTRRLQRDGWAVRTLPVVLMAIVLMSRHSAVSLGVQGSVSENKLKMSRISSKVIDINFCKKIVAPSQVLYKRQGNIFWRNAGFGGSPWSPQMTSLRLAL